MEQPENSFASVIVDLGIDRQLDYEIPPTLRSELKVGMQVKVPIKNKLYSAIVTEIKEKSTIPNLRSIDSLSPHSAYINDSLFKLAKWLAHYYDTSLNKVIQSMLPSCIRNEHGHKEQLFVKRACSKAILQKECAKLQQGQSAQAKVLQELLMTKEGGMLLSELLEKAKVSKSPVTTLQNKGLITLETTKQLRSTFTHDNYFKSEKKKLNQEQEEALHALVNTLKEKKFATHLLYGITGSGKTEIYLQTIDYALSLGLSTLMLVPEIALTEQTIERFRSRFEGKIAILHHRLSEGERFDEWYRIAKNEVQIVIGARSAIFAPLENLGVIIVDEEHEGAYKQSEGFTYHARDVAVMRGHLSSACVILGSATPSLESMYNVSRKKYNLLSLSKRAKNAQLPNVHIIDMKREVEKAKGPTLFSELLIDKIKGRLAVGEQIILFLNRRGYHTTLSCNHCKTIYNCPSCALALTFHRKEQLLSCHLCDYRLSPLPTKCALCGHNETLKYSGIGTEKLESSVHALFPEARVVRIDSDTTRHKGSVERLFTHFRTHKADILIGTQMIAKGLDFPAVTLVALINGDGGLNIPDFRASERVFQLITQVAGRAGRGALPGEVIIQSYLPNHEIIQSACKQDFNLFYQQEIAVRELFDYPPFSHMVKVTFSGKNPTLTEKEAHIFRQELLHYLPQNYIAYPLVPCGYAKIKDYFRFQFLIKGAITAPICLAINKTKSHNRIAKEIKLMVDVDPISTFF